MVMVYCLLIGAARPQFFNMVAASVNLYRRNIIDRHVIHMSCGLWTQSKPVATRIWYIITNERLKILSHPNRYGMRPNFVCLAF